MNDKVKRPNRIFTPEQKYEILKDIEKYPTVREGLEKYQIAPSVYHRWKRQLAVGVNASLDLQRLKKGSGILMRS